MSTDAADAGSDYDASRPLAGSGIRGSYRFAWSTIRLSRNVEKDFAMFDLEYRAVAQELGVHYMTIQNWIKRHGYRKLGSLWIRS